MKIRKTIQGSIPSNKVYNNYNKDKHNVYSTEYLNDKLVHVGTQYPRSQEEVWIKTGKNLFSHKMVKNTDNATFHNGTATQVEADDKTFLQWKVQKYYDENYLGELSESAIRNETGRIAFSFKKTAEFNNAKFGLNGTSRDTLITFDTSSLNNNETYTLSFNIINVTQGSVAWNDIQLERGDKATTYEPYVDKTIYTRNNDDTYEEMINISAVNDLIPQRIYPTFNHDYVYSTDLQYHCYKVGKMVFFNIHTIAFKQEATHGVVFIHNLPKANEHVIWYLKGGNGGDGTPVRCAVNPMGEVMIHYGSTGGIYGESANKQFTGIVIYETNE
jgi:hypothetical protein